jgi:hypothetical protein
MLLPIQPNVNFLLQLGFLLIALIWKFDFAPFMVLIIAILNDGMLCECELFTLRLIKHPNVVRRYE